MSFPVLTFQAAFSTTPSGTNATVDDTNTYGNATFGLSTFGGTPTTITTSLSTLGNQSIYTDLSTRLRKQCVVRRGRQRELDRMEAGTLQLTLDNRDRALDPSNSSSIYFPNVAPMRQCRLTAGYLGVVFRHNPLLFYRLDDVDGATTYTDEARNYDSTSTTGTLTTKFDSHIAGRKSRTFASASIRCNTFTPNLTAAFSISGWFYATGGAGTQRTVLALGGLTTENILVDLGSAGTDKLRIYFLDTGGTSRIVTSTTTPSLNVWHHFVATWDGTTLRLYIDGVADGTPLVPGTMPGYTALPRAVSLGQTLAGAAAWVGALADLSIHPSAISAADVAILTTSGQLSTSVQGLPDGYLFTGYVDSWQQKWSIPNDAMVELSATDGFKVLAARTLPSPWENKVKSLSPRTWWRLGDRESGTLAQDSSGNRYDGVYSGAVGAHESLVLGESDGSTAFDGVTGLVLFPDAASIDSTIQNQFSVSVWAAWEYSATSDRNVVSQGYGVINNSNGGWYIAVSNTGVRFAFRGVNGVTQNLDYTANLADGFPHHIVAYWVINHPTATGGTDMNLFVDGVDRGGDNFNTDHLVPLPIWVGQDDRGVTSAPVVVDEVILFDQLLIGATPATFGAIVADLYATGTAFGSGDLSSARLTRILDYAGWPANLRRISTGVATFGSALHLAGSNALEAVSLVALSEGNPGLVFISADGYLVFRSRQDQFASPLLDARATYGDTPSSIAFPAFSGELPYTDLSLDYEDTRIRNVIRYGNTNSITVEVVDQSSVERYLSRTFEVGGLLTDSGADLVDAAFWTLDHYREPSLDVTAIEIDPRADSDLQGITGIPPSVARNYTQILGRDLGDRINVRRRPPGSVAPSPSSTTTNRLTRSQATMETITPANVTIPDLSGWRSDTNIILAPATIPDAGSFSAKLTSVASGDMKIATLHSTNGTPIPASTQITALAKVRSAVSTRSFNIAVRWYDLFGNLISTSTGSNLTSSTSVFTQNTVTATSPATAAFAAVVVTIVGTAAANEVHYADSASIHVGSSTTYASPDLMESPATIQGITHVLDAEKLTWKTRWALAVAEAQSYLVLNDTVLGRLDANKVGY